MIIVYICGFFIFFGLFAIFLKQEDKTTPPPYKVKLRKICPCYRMSKKKFFPSVYIYFGVFIFIYGVLHAQYAFEIMDLVYSGMAFAIMIIGVFLK